jgi:hypothetical protein
MYFNRKYHIEGLKKCSVTVIILTFTFLLYNWKTIFNTSLFPRDNNLYLRIHCSVKRLKGGGESSGGEGGGGCVFSPPPEDTAAVLKHYNNM